MKTESMRNKLKHEKMNENENEVRKDIGKKKAEALIRLKGIIGDIGEVMIIRGAEGAPDVNISVLTDKERLRETIEKLGRYRIEDGLYLDREAAVMVSYLHDYLYDLRNFIESQPDFPLFVTGIIADRDIKTWSDKAESIVNRDMDAANTEIEEHSSDDWVALKRRIYDELNEKAILCHMHDLVELSERTGCDTGVETEDAWQKLIEAFLKEYSAK